MQARFPNAVELVYDNYNFLVVGFGPTARPSDAIFSLAAQRGGVSLYSLQRATELPDPNDLLRGDSKVVRNVRLAQPADLAQPEVSAVIEAALELARIPMDMAEGPLVIIKSVSRKQRSRR